MSKKWNEERIKLALSILIQSHEYADALESLGETTNSLGSAFKREGLDSPTTYLAATPEEAAYRKAAQLPPNLKSIVVFNDVHVPFHNVNGMNAVLEFCRDTQPDAIVINGDFLDCFSISDFPKNPGMPLLQEEIDQGLEILENLRRSCPLAKITFNEGNHEERLRRMIKTKHGLFGLKAMRLENLLEFDRLQIEYLKYGVIKWFGDLAIYHGQYVSGHAAYSARRELERGGFRYCITGHVHRMGLYHHKGYTGNKVALENGGLFDINQCDYLLNPNWMNGFSIVYQNEEEDFTQINPIPMSYDGTFVWINKWYGV